MGGHLLRSSWHIVLFVAAVYGADQGGRHIKRGTTHGCGRTLVGPTSSGKGTLPTSISWSYRNEI